MKKTQILTIIYMLITIGVIVIIGALDPDLVNIGKAIQSVNGYFLLGALGCVAVFWFTDAMVLSRTTKYLYKRYSFKSVMKWMFIGNYYNALTPFSSGGQPMQVYYMRRKGMPGGYATSILVIKFVMYQGIVCVCAAISLVLHFGYMQANIPNSFYFVVIGFLINGGALLVMLLALFKSNAIMKISTRFIHLFHRLRIVKDEEKALRGTAAFMRDFHAGAQLVSFKALATWRIIFWTFCQFGAYLCVTYFIYRAFGMTLMSFWDIIMMQAILYMAVSFFPLPGASGMSESGFYIFYTTIFPGEYMFISMVLWRIFTYYLNIVVGVVVVLGDSILHIIRKDTKKEPA